MTVHPVHPPAGPADSPTPTESTAAPQATAPARPVLEEEEGTRSGLISPGGKLLFLTRSLEQGGAERQLVALARGLHLRGRALVVVAFYERGPLADDLRAAGVPLRFVGKSGRWDLLGFWRRLLRIVRQEKPDVIHGYLDVPNILASLIARRCGIPYAVWGVRTSAPDPSHFDWMRRATARIETLLARSAGLVIANSRAGRSERIGAGWPADRIVTIPNGIDTEAFRKDRERGLGVRREWGVADDQLLIGVVGRLHPAKDYATFLHAAAPLARRYAHVRLVCVGANGGEYGERMAALAGELGLRDRLIWAGPRTDMPSVYNAIDVLCSSSVTEGLPNAVGEAMACEVPCVVTDAGDSGYLVGEPARVVRRGEPAALTAALEQVVGMSEAARAEEGRRLRRRIEHLFSMERLVATTERVLWRS